MFARFVAPGGFKFCDGPAQTGRALIGGIVGLSLPEGGDGSLLDGLRGVKIRFADGQHGAVGNLPGQIGEDPDLAALKTG